MKRIICRVVGLLVVMGCVAYFANAEEKSLLDEMKIIKQEGEVQEKKDDKVIERYYYKKEIIKEVPEEKGKYEKHLFDELKTRLDKPKKKAEVWRVEGDLIELNKGAIHKVREGDVYKIYGKHGRYKGKMEVGAIADTVSIGRSLKKFHLIEESDTALYIGQRRFWGSGILWGGNFYNKKALILKKDDYEGSGIYWRLLFKHAWGIGFMMGEFSRGTKIRFFKGDSAGMNLENIPSTWMQFVDWSYNEDRTQRWTMIFHYEEEFSFRAPIDMRKYFFHPTWYSCYLGAGTAYFQSKYRANVWKNNEKYSYNSWTGTYGWNIDSQESFDMFYDTKNQFVPLITGGIELSINQYLHINLSGYYFHGPKIDIGGYKPMTRPLILSAAFVGTW